MYAIIKTGGKQYTVKPGDVLRIERLDAELGSELKIDVLMIGGDKIFIGDKAAKAVVNAVVTDQERGPKVVVFKKKRRQGYRRMGGHRQPYTEIFVTSITNPEGTTAKADGKPQVYNPERKAEKLAKGEEIRLMKNEAARKAAKAEGAAPAPKKAAAKKAAPKKAAGAKKKSTKKPAGKKAAKKTTKK